MVLKAIIGGYDVNDTAILEAFQYPPSLIIDCGNCADPHRLFPYITQEQLHQVYVMNTEAIYRFRDTLREVPAWLKRLHIKKVIITTISTLYSYDNEVENYNIIEQCWEMLAELSKTYPITVAVKQGSTCNHFARRFAQTTYPKTNKQNLTKKGRGGGGRGWRVTPKQY